MSPDFRDASERHFGDGELLLAEGRLGQPGITAMQLSSVG